MSQYVKVYTTANCQSCRATKRWLDQRRIPYEAIDVTESPSLADEIRAVSVRTGQPAHMPFVEVHDELEDEPVQWFGFQPAMLTEHAATSTAA